MKFIFSSVLSTIFLLGYLDFSNAQCADPVGNLSLEEDDVSGDITVSWTAPSSGCAQSYRITATNNAPSPTSIEYTTDATSFVIAGLQLVPCSSTTVTVVPVGDGDGPASSVSRTLAIRASSAPILYNMTTSCDSIEMYWEGQSFQENMCIFTHFQLICLSDTHNFTIPVSVTDNHDRTFRILMNTILRPDTFYFCNGFMFVTLGGFSPESPTIEFWSNLDAIRDLEVTESETSLYATWQPPLNSEQCGVAYYVSYENPEIGTNTYTTDKLEYQFSFDIIPCTVYTISVTPISFTGSAGTEVVDLYEPVVSVTRVEELTVTDNADSLTVSWRSVNIGKCDVIFEVEHYVNGELYNTAETTSNSVQLSRIPCSDNVFEVVVVSSGVPGEVVSLDLHLSSGDVGGLSEVRNIQINGGVVSWDPPSSVGRCAVNYEVLHSDPFSSNTVITSSTELSLTLIPCSSNIVSIRAVDGDLSGPPVEHSFIAGAAQFEAPENLQTIPAYTSAQVTMGAELRNVNSCPISEALVSCTNDGTDSFERTLAVTDNDERRFILELDDLEQDTIYTCYVRWATSPDSLAIRFRTIPIPSKALSVNDINENGFTVQWTEDYGTDFVSSYQLVIESNGPAHDVRDDCDIERSNTYTFNLESGVLNSVFVEGFPDFDYEIYLVTVYNLGTQGVKATSETLGANTLTDAPGAPDDLGIEFEYEGGTVYNVTGLISWRSPCELNGALRSFGVTVRASFQLGGVEQTLEYSRSVAGTNPNDRYSYALLEINPFFRYVVTINTVAAQEGPGRDIEITPPDVCSCASD